MSCKKRILAGALASIITIMSLTLVSEADGNDTESFKRVIVISNKDNKKVMKDSLKKFRYKKIKDLPNLGDAEVIFLEDSEFEKLKSESNFKVFEDIPINVSKPKASKQPQQISWGTKRIGADKAWDTNTGKGVKVAVVDSGINKHPDIKKNIKGEFNAIEPGKPATDYYGHGTHVAGIIASRDNKVGVVGVSPDTSLYAVKVLDANGSGYLSDLTEGIEWCINNNIQIINLSLEVQNDSTILKESVKRALDAGIVVVSAAGNTCGGNAAFPAAYEGVISVGAIDENDKLSELSAVGKVDLCAPGVNILSTYLNDGYTTLSGTSIAAPHVTGVLALMMADKSNDINNDGVVSANEVKALIPMRTEDIGTVGYDSLYGNGILKYIHN